MRASRLILIFAVAVSSQAFGIEEGSFDVPNSNNGPASKLGIGPVDPAQYKACGEDGNATQGKISSQKGYLGVMVKSFARSVCRPDSDRAKAVMVKGKAGGDTVKNAKNPEDGGLIDDYLLLFALGLKESSGNFQEGRDQNASNTSANTAEAGAFQSSADIKGCVDDQAKLGLESLEKSYAGASAQDCMSDVAQIPPTRVADATQGGMQFQRALKACPALAVEHAAITIRHCSSHYGTINTGIVKKMEGCRPLLQSLYKQLKNDPMTCSNLYNYGTDRGLASIASHSVGGGAANAAGSVSNALNQTVRAVRTSR